MDAEQNAPATEAPAQESATTQESTQSPAAPAAEPKPGPATQNLMRRLMAAETEVKKAQELQKKYEQLEASLKADPVGFVRQFGVNIPDPAPPEPLDPVDELKHTVSTLESKLAEMDAAERQQLEEAYQQEQLEATAAWLKSEDKASAYPITSAHKEGSALVLNQVQWHTQSDTPISEDDAAKQIEEYLYGIAETALSIPSVRARLLPEATSAPRKASTLTNAMSAQQPTSAPEPQGLLPKKESLDLLVKKYASRT